MHNKKVLVVLFIFLYSFLHSKTLYLDYTIMPFELFLKFI